jgi:DNA-binding transcriptional ArsR family regulator
MKARTRNPAPSKAQSASPSRPQPMIPEALELVAARFRAMGEPLRLRMLYELELGEHSVSALAKIVGSTQPNVSKHLKVLQDAGMLKRRRQGNTALYGIADAMVFELCDMICTRLRDRLEAQVGALNGRARARPRRPPGSFIG